MALSIPSSVKNLVRQAQGFLPQSKQYQIGAGLLLVAAGAVAVKLYNSSKTTTQDDTATRAQAKTVAAQLDKISSFIEAVRAKKADARALLSNYAADPKEETLAALGSTYSLAREAVATSMLSQYRNQIARVSGMNTLLHSVAGKPFDNQAAAETAIKDAVKALIKSGENAHLGIFSDADDKKVDALVKLVVDTLVTFENNGEKTENGQPVKLVLKSADKVVAYQDTYGAYSRQLGAYEAKYRVVDTAWRDLKAAREDAGRADELAGLQTDLETAEREFHAELSKLYPVAADLRAALTSKEDRPLDIRMNKDLSMLLLLADHVAQADKSATALVRNPALFKFIVFPNIDKLAFVTTEGTGALNPNADGKVLMTKEEAQVLAATDPENLKTLALTDARTAHKVQLDALLKLEAEVKELEKSQLAIAKTLAKLTAEVTKSDAELKAAKAELATLESADVSKLEGEAKTKHAQDLKDTKALIAKLEPLMKAVDGLTADDTKNLALAKAAAKSSLVAKLVVAQIELRMSETGLAEKAAERDAAQDALNKNTLSVYANDARVYVNAAQAAKQKLSVIQALADLDRKCRRHVEAAILRLATA
ncbi:MAG: hypothetical protein GWP59_02375 [Chlamydiales bacterium]|nr:hypothetical protein [Chlamydiales bacterium]